jgi:hypothetical protein
LEFLKTEDREGGSQPLLAELQKSGEKFLAERAWRYSHFLEEISKAGVRAGNHPIDIVDQVHNVEMSREEFREFAKLVVPVLAASAEKNEGVIAWTACHDIENNVRVIMELGWEHRPPGLAEILRTMMRIDSVLGESGKTADSLYKMVPRATSVYFSFQDTKDPIEELELMTSYYANFGMGLPALFAAYRHLVREEPLTSELRAAGIKNTGSEGVRQLRELRRTLMDGSLNPAESLPLESRIHEELLVAISRFDESEWKRNENFRQLAEAFCESASKGEVAPLAAHWTKGKFRAALIDKEALQKFNFAEPCRVKLKELALDVRKVLGLAGPDVLEQEKSFVRGVLGSWRQNVAASLDAPNEGIKDAKRVEGQRRYMEDLDKLLKSLDKTKQLKEAIAVLAESRLKESPEISGALRRLLVANLPQEVIRPRSVVDSNAAEEAKEQIGQVVNIFQHLVLQESLPTLGLSQNGIKRVKAACKVDALLQDLARLQNIGTRGYMDLTVVPHRGLLGELSGFICDACWTKERGFLQKYPKVTPLLFLHGEGTPEQKLVGACLVIETETCEGEKVLVLRGINPLQNTITKLSAKDFFESFVDDYIVPIAKGAGAKKILVPWNASAGGSQTNRPDLNLYIASAYPKSNTVPLADVRGTTVNGYDVSRICVPVREIEPSSGA